MGVDCNGPPYKINFEIVESRQRDFTISRSFATVLETKDPQQFSGRLLDVITDKRTDVWSGDFII